MMVAVALMQQRVIVNNFYAKNALSFRVHKIESFYRIKIKSRIPVREHLPEAGRFKVSGLNGLWCLTRFKLNIKTFKDKHSTDTAPPLYTCY